MYNLNDNRGGYTLINDGNLPRLVSQPNRPTGIHLSNILAKIHGYSDSIQPETKQSQSEFEPNNLMELGTMFEFALKHWLAVNNPDRYILDPPPLILDGIHMTPDLYDLERDAYPDIKFTKKSARACPGGVSPDDKRFDYWEMQVKSYCHGDKCPNGQLMVCHVNGIYAWLSKRASVEEIANDDTVFNIWERHYTDEELIANWAIVMAHKEIG